MAVATALACLALASCGGGSGSATSPSGGSGTGNSSGSCTTAGPLGSAKGSMTATINGSTFKGGVPAGESIYTPIAAQPSLGLPAQDFFVTSATCGDLTSLQIIARAVVGPTVIGVDAGGNPLIDAQTKQPLVHQGLLQLRANGVAAGTWITSLLGGTGSITVTSVSTAAATGSFSLTMVPRAGTAASGNRTVTGTFNVTF